MNQKTDVADQWELTSHLFHRNPHGLTLASYMWTIVNPKQSQLIKLVRYVGDLKLLTYQPLLPLCLWSQPLACQARELQFGPCPLFHFSSVDII